MPTSEAIRKDLLVPEQINQAIPPLRECARICVEKYLSQLDGQKISNLYGLVLSEIEQPLFKAVLDFTSGNQSVASELLGISRGTLRKKLELYDLL